MASRTVRARIPADLEVALDEAMKCEERTESDLVRRALKLYLFGPGIGPGAEKAYSALTTPGGKNFRGPDPRKKS